MFHVKQPLRLAAFTGLVALSLLLLACSRAAGSRGWAAPVPLGDLVLISTSKGHLTAINATSRAQLWRYPDCWEVNEKGARSLSGIYGAPVASRDNQTIFLGDYSGYVHAFNVRNYDCQSNAERPTSGAFKLDDHIIGGVALDASSENLYVTAGHRLYSIRARDLISRIENNKADVQLTEVFEAGKDIWSTPVVTPTGILISSVDGNLYMIDASGKETWRYSAGGALASTPVISGGTNGLVLVGGFDGVLHAVDLASGQERWTFKASNWVWSSPLVDGGRAYFGDFDGKLYAIDVSSGKEAWSLKLGKGAIRSAPALASGTLVVATESGWLIGVDPGGQSTKWETKIETGIAADLTVRSDTVLIAPRGCVKVGESDTKTYYAGVDPRTGSLAQASGVC